MPRVVPTLVAILAAAALSACRSQPAQPAALKESPDSRVKSLADTYLTAYFDRYPEDATTYGLAGRQHSAMFDNSLAALSAWKSQEDAWLAQAKAIDPAS